MVSHTSTQLRKVWEIVEWFWNTDVESLDDLPSYLSELNLEPEKCYGYGLGKEDIEKITGNTFTPPDEVETEVKSEEHNLSTVKGKVYYTDNVEIWTGGVKLQGFITEEKTNDNN